jgi:hypothetical protein
MSPDVTNPARKQRANMAGGRTCFETETRTNHKLCIQSNMQTATPSRTRQRHWTQIKMSVISRDQIRHTGSFRTEGRAQQKGVFVTEVPHTGESNMAL